MKFLLLIAITYVLLVLQVSVAKDVAIGRAVPHLMLAGLVICAQRLRRLPSLGLAAGWGLLTDCLGGGLLGPQLVVCVLLAEILAVLARRPAGVRWWQAALVTIPGVCLAQVGSPWVARLVEGPSLAVGPLVAPA